VVGFDNTRMASEMNPTLTSIGTCGTSLGQKAIETLIDMMNGEPVSSVKVETKVFGRQSFLYEIYQYNNRDLLGVNKDFIYRMFDDCFYRYGSSAIRQSAVDIRRLYFEIMYRILCAYRDKYLPIEEFEEIGSMIDVFFSNGAMDYTDAEKLLECVRRLQNSLNMIQRSLAVNSLINRLFLRMKDDCIKEICRQNIDQRNISYSYTKRMRDHLIIGMDYDDNKDKTLANYIKNMGLICVDNGSLYLFDKPVQQIEGESITYPEDIIMKCFIKGGELYLTTKDRQLKKTKDLFRQIAEMSRLDCLAVFPIVYRKKTYGFFFSELSERVYNMGSFMVTTIGMNLRLLEQDE